MRGASRRTPLTGAKRGRAADLAEALAGVTVVVDLVEAVVDQGEDFLEVAHLVEVEEGLGEEADLEVVNREEVLLVLLLAESEDPTNTCKRLPSLWERVGSEELQGHFG